MVKLKEIYDKTENPLEKQGVLEKIIQAYADSERTSLSTPSNLYEYLVTMNQNKDNTRVNKKDEENFYVETYNEWIENMLNLNSSDIKKLEESGIKAKEMQKYLNAFGKVSSMEDIKRLNKNPLFDETGSVNGWQINTSSWEHVKSRLVKARQEGSLSIKHRLYVGCQMQDLWKLAKDFKDKCNEKQIPYYFKLATNTRDDKMVIYADTDVLFKGDLSEVFDIDISDYECAAVAMEPNNENMICHKYFPENKNELTFISSFIVFNSKKMREENFVSRMYETIRKFNTRLKFFDVDVLNITCDKIYALPYRYGVFQSLYYQDDWSTSYEYSFLKNVYSDEELREEVKNVVMLHYAGKPGKPWRRKYIPADYKECLDSIPKKLRKFTFRDIRKRLLSKFQLKF